VTGTTPFEKETLARAALDEMRRMIRETEPPTPSMRLQGLGQRLDEVARQRHTEPSLLPRLVRGDLDWIVMKALEKDRARRYETANGLAMDVQRYLRGEPVVAGPPSNIYRAGKFMRRHRLAVAAFAGVTLALAVGLALALLGFTQARRAGHRAEEEAATAKAINDFLTKDLLAQASPENISNRDVTVREVLDRAASKIQAQFTNNPSVEASIRLTLGRTYLTLDQPVGAEPQLQRAFEIRRQVLGPDHPDTLEATVDMAEDCAEQGDDRRAEKLLQEAAAAYRRTMGPDHPRTLDCLQTLGNAYLAWKRPDQADGVFRELLEQRRRLNGPEDPKTLEAMNGLADVIRLSGRPADAARLDEEALQIGRRVLSPSWTLTTLMNNLGADYWALGDCSNAIALASEVVEVNRRVLGQQHVVTRISAHNLASLYGAVGLWAPCVRLCQEVRQQSDNSRRWFEMSYRGAVAALLAADTNAFRQFAEAILSRYASTTNANRARGVCEICFLTPDAVPDLAPVFKLARLDLLEDDTIPWYGQIARGMEEYRRGNLEEALKWFEQPRHCFWSPAASQAGYFCAMIRYQQGDTNAARTDLANAASRLAAYVRSGELGGPRDKDFWLFSGPNGIYLRSTEFQNNWHEYGRAVAVGTEAERLILGHEISAPADFRRLESARQHWAPVRLRLNEAARLAGRKKWTEASAAYIGATRDPEFAWETAESLEQFLAFKIGVSLLLAGDNQHYKALCLSAFDRLREHPDGVYAFLVLKTCLAREIGAQSELIKQIGMWLPKISYDDDQASLVRAIGDYRLNRYAESLDQIHAAEFSARLATRGVARIFRAMSLAQLGRWEEGKGELAQAEADLGQHLANMTGDVWWDLAFCQLALDEAHGLFEGHSKSRP